MAAKIYVFEGPESSGKTLLAKEIANCLGFPKSVVISVRNKRFLTDSFFFRDCTKETELIVLDDLFIFKNNKHQHGHILSYKDGITVAKQGFKSFEIQPVIIITTNTNIGSFNNTPGVEIFKFPITYLESRAIKDEILKKD